MVRLGLASLLAVSTLACASSTPSTPDDPQPVAAEPEPQVEPEPETEPEPEPEPEPQVEEEPEVTRVDEDVFRKDSFEARDLHCTLNQPMRGAAGYIHAGLADQDAALDACAPKGAAIAVQWEYIGAQAQNITVEASSQKIANCMAAAMSGVRAGVSAKCSAVLLVGDLEAATAAYQSR